jgi:hypothetical protein
MCDNGNSIFQLNAAFGCMRKLAARTMHLRAHALSLASHSVLVYIWDKFKRKVDIDSRIPEPHRNYDRANRERISLQNT